MGPVVLFRVGRDAIEEWILLGAGWSAARVHRDQGLKGGHMMGIKRLLMIRRRRQGKKQLAVARSPFDLPVLMALGQRVLVNMDSYLY